MKTLDVRLSGESYKIFIEPGLLDIGPHLPFPTTTRLAVVTDENVDRLHGERVMRSLEEAGYKAERVVVPPGEGTKSLANLERVLSRFAELELTRSDAVIALGGGVMGDLAGFAAAVWLRGVRFVQVPTTLLSMTDSSIGGKTGVNLPAGKNVAGAFHQPTRVLIDPLALTTLPAREFASGMAEVVKHACIKSRALFGQLKTPGALQASLGEIIAANLAIKRDVVQADSFERDERRLLNFGHTLGHAVEKAAGYGKILHGEGVAIGMVGAARLGEAMGFTEPGTAAAIAELLTAFGLPIAPETPLETGSALLNDKKRMGSVLNVVLLRTIGDAEVVPLPAEEAQARFKEVNAWMV